VYTEPNRTMKAYSDASVWRYTHAVRLFLGALALFITVMEITLVWAFVAS